LADPGRIESGLTFLQSRSVVFCVQPFFCKKNGCSGSSGSRSIYMMMPSLADSLQGANAPTTTIEPFASIHGAQKA